MVGAIDRTTRDGLMGAPTLCIAYRGRRHARCCNPAGRPYHAVLVRPFGALSPAPENPRGQGARPYGVGAPRRGGGVVQSSLQGVAMGTLEWSVRVYVPPSQDRTALRWWL